MEWIEIFLTELNFSMTEIHEEILVMNCFVQIKWDKDIVQLHKSTLNEGA